MANISGVEQNIPLVKKSYKKVLALGEGAKADDFRMTIDDAEFKDLEFLVQTIQIAGMSREMVEDIYGPHGVGFTQYGRYKNAVQVPITFKEVISGAAYKAVRSWIKNKKYLTLKLALISESLPNSNASNSWMYEDTALALDEGFDLSVEENTLIKPTGTLYVNWPSHFDDEDHSMGWE